MNRETSIYLDLVRLSAAVTVFLSHAAWRHSSGGLLWQFEGHGREAVDVFFVLSGFVIGYAVDGRERSAVEFGVNRLARLYSVALPAIVLTFILDGIGRSWRPDLYRGWCCDISGSEATQYLSSSVFLNEIWWLHAPPGSDVPYWSLGFEALYYAAFGGAWFMRKPWNLLAAAIVMAVAGPGIAVLFPLWLIGLACYRLCARRPPGCRLGIVLFAGSLLGLAANIVWGSRYGEIYGEFELTAARMHDYVQDYIVGLLFAANLVGFRAISGLFPGTLERVARPIRWLAGATFTLYLLHQPLIHFLVAVAPWSEFGLADPNPGVRRRADAGPVAGRSDGAPSQRLAPRDHDAARPASGRRRPEQPDLIRPTRSRGPPAARTATECARLRAMPRSRLRNTPVRRRSRRHVRRSAAGPAAAPGVRRRMPAATPAAWSPARPAA